MSGGSLNQFLSAIGMLDYTGIFAENAIDIGSLPLLSEEDLEKMGIKMGPRKKLMIKIEELKMSRDDVRNPGGQESLNVQPVDDGKIFLPSVPEDPFDGVY